eukprot:TRINITY_DN6843_c0_g3_i1.p3 TRINITY_DN6843_c0_g3~~TRINITY_DN6843_c0_g3_i1.p3  ORF type:complete len:143 (+),score=26.84 TRINITY_DN6843_c0_g3_i1:134-562(+)
MCIRDSQNPLIQTIKICIGGVFKTQIYAKMDIQKAIEARGEMFNHNDESEMVDLKAELRVKEFKHGTTFAEAKVKKGMYSEQLRKIDRENFITKKRLLPTANFHSSEYPALKVNLHIQLRSKSSLHSSIISILRIRNAHTRQ